MASKLADKSEMAHKITTLEAQRDVGLLRLELKLRDQFERQRAESAAIRCVGQSLV